MKEILIKNEELLDRLNKFIKSTSDLNLNEIFVARMGGKHDKLSATSEEYLEIVLADEKFKGPPLTSLMTDISKNPRIQSKKWQDLAKDIANDFTKELGMQQNALLAYYPKDGWIGWHDNHDADGYTVLFNWSEGGDAFYRYRDWETGKIHTINDKPGWTCKTGWYGPGEKSTWHCAMTNEPRWSIAFYARNENMRDIIVDYIENND